ncbi:MAG: TolC family protein [Cytophagales bacterium]|nr:TolC family protein [Bernardetiaceae bacterium]MDW8205852.1 TolC family protein [Cytophagales bacterium]
MQPKQLILTIACLLVYTHFVSAQTDTAFVRLPLRYADFLAQVGQENRLFAAEKFNISLAEASIEIAKIFPDPELGFGWFDNGQRRMQMGYGFETAIGWTLELGGKRKARIALAQSERELTRYLVQDFYRNLRADATLSFLSALHNRFQYQVRLSSYQSMRQIALSDSVRYRLGAITEIDARQSLLEAGAMLNDVFQAEADWKSSLAALHLLIARPVSADTLLLPEGDFSRFERNFNLNELIITAQNNRADLMAALQQKDVGEKMLRLAKANRIIDLGLAAGIGYTSYVTNVIAPTPSFTAVTGGIAIPLRFSNKFAGELKAAKAVQAQADVLYQQAELQIQNEVTQAYFQYEAAKKQVRQFNTGLLGEAQAVLSGKIYSYQRGETSLLEVLNAQRTYNEVQQNYYSALFQLAATLVELERAAAIWDIDL